MGISLLSILNNKDNGKISFNSELSDSFLLNMNSGYVIDKISMVMVVFGRSSEEVCRNCQNKHIFFN